MKRKYLLSLLVSVICLSSCDDTENDHNDNIEEYHYNLPIIFHVLYKDKTDPLQYVPQSRLAEMLDAVNQLYKGTPNKSVDMNLTFTLAITDPDGKTLPEPGVEYIEWDESYPINCNKFMNDNTTKGGVGYVKYLWDPNQYINVMVYNFTEDSYAIGVSYRPYSIEGDHYLDGLYKTNNLYMGLNNLPYPHCLSISSLYIYEQSSPTEYNSNDITVILAHELGHYLGLCHVFSETENEDDCEDTDYCEDTPTYNRKQYMADYLYIMENEPENFTNEYLMFRTECKTGQKFVSRNIMDTAFSNSDQFTPDQRKRIRHVLNYSPLIPGPKKGQAATRAAAPEGVLELSVRTVK